MTACVVAGLATLAIAAGCLDSTGKRWGGIGQSEAARNPDPNARSYAEYQQTEASLDSEAYEPTPEPQLASDQPTKDANGSQQAVDDYLSKLNAATNHSDEHRSPTHDSDVASGRKRSARPNDESIAFDQNDRAKKPIAIRPRPAEQSLPDEAKHRSAPSGVPSVASVGVRGSNSFNVRQANDRPNDHVPQQPPASAVRVQQGMDLDELANSRDLQDLIDAARNELTADPRNPRKQLRLSLLQLANDQPEAAAQLSPEINGRERELIARFVASIGRVDSQFSDPMLSTDAVLASIEELRDSLRDTAELTIPTVALCSRVKTFGIYDELPKGALRANRADRAIVYCEVDHFMSRFDEETNQYRTELSSHLELFTAEGKSIWTQTEEKINDFSRQRREDFFLAQLITLPSDVGSGEYVLKVSITDLQASKTTEAVHRFEVQ